MALKEIQGQERALGRLRALLSTRRLPPALLFAGPRGVGKATAAAEFAKALNCGGAAPSGERRTTAASRDDGPGRRSGANSDVTPAPAESAAGGFGPLAIDACEACASCIQASKGLDPDLQRVDAAFQASLLDEEEAKQRSIKVDTIRHLISLIMRSSLSGRFKTAIVEDAHLLVPEAANAMLKTLEEPPPGTLWILVTHQAERLLPTIRSRCQTVPFAPLSPGLVSSLLQARGVPAPEATALARRSEGSLGRALQLSRETVPDPAQWLGDPMAPFRLAEKLPREPHAARAEVESQLARMAWHARERSGLEGYAQAPVRDALRGFANFRRALAANADPRLVLLLAAMSVERLHPSPK